MAVRTVVCMQCARKGAAVRLVVYGSARGSVRLSGSTAVCDSALGSVSQCAQQCCAAVRQCAAVCGRASGYVRQFVRQFAAVCGSAHGSVRAVRAVYAAVCGSALRRM